MSKGRDSFAVEMKDNSPLHTYTSSLHLTLKAWPVIAVATIGLCFLTQQVAGWFGIALPDQKNIEIVKAHAGWNKTFVLLCFQIVILLPAVEELYFRYFVYRRAQEPLAKRNLLFSLIPTAAFCALAVGAWCSPQIHARMLAKVAAPAFFTAAAFGLAAEYAVRVCLGRAIAKTSVGSIAVASAVLFSAAHYLAQPFPDAAFIALAFFGFAQCWLYRRTGRLWCPMLNHALFNLTNLILLFIVPEGRG